MPHSRRLGPPCAAGDIRVGADGSGSSRPPVPGLLFDIRRYTIHDGPGIRTTVFLKGCPLNCLWCHNPEGKDLRPQLSFVSGRCLRCDECVAVCPASAIHLAPGAFPLTDRLKCLTCGRCVQVCRTGARIVLGKTQSAGEVLTVVERDRIFYDQSGGGVTFSGGEPLAQAGFLRECLRECRKRGIHAVLDTSGFADRITLLETAKLANLVLYDLKDMNPDRHLQTVGVPLDPILENLRALASESIPVWVRIPAIPGVNDDDSTIRNYRRYLEGLGARYPVSVLPYHAFGFEKYSRLGLPYHLAELSPPSEEDLARWVGAFRETQFQVSIGG